MSILLSKSKYLNGIQCPKYLWFVLNRPDVLQEPDEAVRHRFDEGYRVGDIAKQLFPGGIDIQTENFNKNLEESKKRLSERKAMFEAGFKANFDKIELYSRADILAPVENDQWDIIEVKSSAEVKDINIHDVSFQKFVYELNGMKIRNCYVLHINSEYIRNGKIEPDKLLVKEDITSRVKKALEGIKERIISMQGVMLQKAVPSIKIGIQCEDPYTCPAMKECWKNVPENSVFDLYRIKKTAAFELFERGIVSISDMPNDYKLNEKQALQKKCLLTDKECIDKRAIKNFLKDIKCPIYFMDFETYQTAIPPYNGSWPYQQMPFQFSVHIVNEEGKTEHISFIAEGDEDPRKEFAKRLREAIGEDGTIIVYNKSFEQRMLKELAEFMPEYSEWVESLDKRMIDLLVPFRSFYYYNSKQKGSASIKDVLPALTGKNYEDLEIKNGASASVLYFYITHGKKYGLNPTSEEAEKIRKDLEKYCGLDTEGMILILNRLRELSS